MTSCQIKFMQRLDLGSQGNQYMDDLNIGPSGDLSFPSMGAGTHGMTHPQQGETTLGPCQGSSGSIGICRQLRAHARTVVDL
ncbi:hypothetical protein DPMN_122934 [Dreissena polymorpha]|uniref:Uncharacterized protein n=1 Tax=Dreissena polymorpha TaxID=45954 RepID=A0A9D4GTG3_DREPO|nr:hypothetical protein DPMN_122934 [Dreissena polymorpha]